MKIIEDKQLDQLIWLSPRPYGWSVFVGEVSVSLTKTPEQAEKLVTRLKNAVVVALKQEIVELAGTICDRCQTEMPKRVRTKFGIGIFHKDKSLGYQPCNADYLWEALIRDTLARKEQSPDHGVHEAVRAEACGNALRTRGSL